MIRTSRRVTEASAAIPGSSTSYWTKWTAGPIQTSCRRRRRKEFTRKMAFYWNRSVKTPSPHQIQRDTTFGRASDHANSI